MLHYYGEAFIILPYAIYDTNETDANHTRYMSLA